MLMVGDCSGTNGNGVTDGRLRASRLRESEIQNFHRAIRLDLDVARFQIAMDDSFFVRGFERIADLPSDS
jgi:hypothetical protein